MGFKLFTGKNAGFTTDYSKMVPEPFADMEQQPDAATAIKNGWNTQMNPGGSVKVNAYILTALLANAKKVPACILEMGDQVYIAEYEYENIQYVARYNAQNKELSAAIVNNSIFKPFPAVGQTKSEANLTVLYILLEYAISLINTNYANMLNMLETSTDTDELIKCAYKLSDYTKFWLDNNNIVNIPKDGNIELFDKKSVNEIRENGNVILGTPVYFAVRDVEAPDCNVVIYRKAKKEFFEFSANRNWSEQEQELIP